MTIIISTISETGRLPFDSKPIGTTTTTPQRRMTAQFEDDPLRNLVMSNHALTDCYALLENRHLLDLKELLYGLRAKTQADSAVYRNVGANLAKRATIEEEERFIQTLYDGPLQVLSNFSLSLEFCLVLLSRSELALLEKELHQLQETLRKNIAACYQWVKEWQAGVNH